MYRHWWLFLLEKNFKYFDKEASGTTERSLLERIATFFVFLIWIGTQRDIPSPNVQLKASAIWIAFELFSLGNVLCSSSFVSPHRVVHFIVLLSWNIRGRCSLNLSCRQGIIVTLTYSCDLWAPFIQRQDCLFSWKFSGLVVLWAVANVTLPVCSLLTRCIIAIYCFLLGEEGSLWWVLVTHFGSSEIRTDSLCLL